MMNWIISSSILILIIITIRHFLKGKMSLRLQYALWLIVAVRLLFPFSIGEAMASVSTWLDLVGDRQEVQEIIDYTKTPMQTMPYEDAYDSVADDYLEIGINIENLPEDVLNGTIEDEVWDKMHQGYTPEEIANFLWKLGMVVVGAWFLFSNIHFSLKLRKDRVCLKEYGKLKVYQTNSVETPCLYGFFPPAIYVTNEVVGDETRMQHVLEHEITHFRHGDYIWSLVRVVCLVLHWYNPLVWCAAFLSRRDAELACDEATIKRLGEAERASYGRTLIGLTCEKRPAVLITATTMTGSKRSIKERIKLIAQKPKMAVITLLAVIILAVTAIGWTFAGTKPSYESFSEWTKTIEPEKVKHFHVAKGFGKDSLRYDATEAEVVEFLELIQTISEDECYRRDQYAKGYEDYYLFFENDGEGVQLKCLEDKTVEYVYNSDFAPQGRTLIIDSPKLWNYIVDTVNEKGETSSEDSNDDLLSSFEDVETIYMKADLNHDGCGDSIELVKISTMDITGKVLHDDSVTVEVRIGKQGGGYEPHVAYFNHMVDRTHSGNGTYVLTQKDGKDYLLYTRCYEMQGGATYEYSVMYIKDNEVVTVQKNTINFCTDPYWSNKGKIPTRKEVIPGWKAELEPWIESGIILVSFDVATETFINTSDKEIPASAYYDLVWARNEDEKWAQFEEEVGKEQWKKELYYASDFRDIATERDWIEKTSKESFSKWYKEYNGSTLQCIDNEERKPNEMYSGNIPRNDEVVYYHAVAGEDAQDAIYKMLECMIKERMIPDDYRTCTYTAYAIPKQTLVPVTEHMWFVPFLNGYYAFEGKDFCTMQEFIDAGEPVTEDGLIQFFAQGSSEQYFHILIEKDGVYRLERLYNMME